MNMLKGRPSIQAGKRSGTTGIWGNSTWKNVKFLTWEGQAYNSTGWTLSVEQLCGKGPGDPAGSWAWDCRNAGSRGATSILCCWNSSRTRTSRKGIITLYSALITSHLDILLSLGPPNAGKTSINWRGFKGSYSDGGGWTTSMWGGAGGVELVHSGAAMGSETWQRPPVPAARSLNWQIWAPHSKMRNNGHKEKQKLRLGIRRSSFHHDDCQAMAQAPKRGCAVFILGSFQDLTV